MDYDPSINKRGGYTLPPIMIIMIIIIIIHLFIFQISSCLVTFFPHANHRVV